MPTIEDALQLALNAHRGQKDKFDMPYILHPLRVMAKQTSDETRIVALLHDVVEDSATTLEDLRQMGYSEAIIAAVDALTHRDDEDYFDQIRRAKNNLLARPVKQADLEDNMDIRRIPTITPKDAERLARYREAYKLITE
jgi:(p)ppGpp synthase/HD superfamily hydrolase